LDKALPQLQEALKLTQAKLGAEHPYTLAGMNSLATCYWSLKRFDDSIPLLEAALKIKEKKLGRQHPDTQVTVANLGVNYKDTGRLVEGLPLLEEAHRSAKSSPKLRWVTGQLLEGYKKAGRTKDAAGLILESLAERRAELPKDSPRLAG